MWKVFGCDEKTAMIDCLRWRTVKFSCICMLLAFFVLNTAIKSLPSHRFVSVAAYVMVEVPTSNAVFSCPDVFLYVIT